jgi:hypothetical protein
MDSPHGKSIEEHLQMLTADEMLDLASELIDRARRSMPRTKKVDWDRFSGLLKHGPYPLEYQNAIRGDWASSSTRTPF